MSAILLALVAKWAAPVIGGLAAVAAFFGAIFAAFQSGKVRAQLDAARDVGQAAAQAKRASDDVGGLKPADVDHELRDIFRD